MARQALQLLGQASGTLLVAFGGKKLVLHLANKKWKNEDNEQFARRIAAALTVLTAIGLSFAANKGKGYGKMLGQAALLSLPVAPTLYSEAKEKMFAFPPLSGL